jgi:hypothetical protein
LRGAARLVSEKVNNERGIRFAILGSDVADAVGLEDAKDLGLAVHGVHGQIVTKIQGGKGTYMFQNWSMLPPAASMIMVLQFVIERRTGQIVTLFY